MEKEKTCYSDAELLEFKVLIEQKIHIAQAEVNFFNQAMASRAGSSVGKDFRFDSEGSAYSHESKHLNQMRGRQVKFISHLKQALVRIANKSYGRCNKTDTLISKKRLKAVPHATLSIEAKKAQLA